MPVFLHHLETVVEVLPNDIQRGYDAAQGIQIALRHPDGQHRVFLPQGLSARHTVAITLADDMADEELQETQENGNYHHPKEHHPVLVKLSQ